MKNVEGLTAKFNNNNNNNSEETKTTANGSRGHGYAKLIAKRCAHLEHKNGDISSNLEKGILHQNGKAGTTTSKSVPSSPTKTYRSCCASSQSNPSSSSSNQNPEKLFTNSEPSSPKRKDRILLRQSAVKNSKESLIIFDHHEKLPCRNINNNINIAKIPNRAIPSKKCSSEEDSSSKASIITTTTRNSQTKNHHKYACNGNNGMTNSIANTNGSGKSPTFSDTEITQRSQNHANYLNMTTITIPVNTKEIKKNFKVDFSNPRQPFCVLKPSSQPPPPQKLQSTTKTRKRQQEHTAIKIPPVSTITKTISSNSLSRPQQQKHEQSRKLISREATILSPNGTKTYEEERKQINKINLKTNSSSSTSSISSLNKRHGNAKVSLSLSTRTTTSNNNGLGIVHPPKKIKIKPCSGAKMDNGHNNRDEEEDDDDSNNSEDSSGHQLLEFIEPLEPNLEFVEGSNFDLTVKIQGAKKVVWVKNDKIVPNIPPDFEYKSNPLDGTFCLRIQDAFLEDSGLYICEAYGSDQESDAICWCRVDVIEETYEDDTTSVELEEVHEQPSRRLIVPLIITSDASEFEDGFIMEPSSSITPDAGEKRIMYRELRDISTNSSKDFFEDALEELSEASSSRKEPKLSSNGMDSSCILNESDLIETCEDQLSNDYEQLNGTFVGSDSINYNSEVHHPLNETNSVNNFNGDMSLCSSVNEIQDLDILNESKSLDFETSRDFSDDSLQSSSPEVKVEKSFDQSLGSCDMSICSTTYSADKDNFDRTIGSAEMSFSTVEEISEKDDASPRSSTNPLLSQSSTESMSSGQSLDEAIISPIFRPLQSRDSVTDQLLPRILIGPYNAIAMLGENVNLRVKIQSTDEANTTIRWCKFVRGVYRKLGSITGLEAETEEDASSHIQIKKINPELFSLSIKEVNYEDSGKYRVKVQNLLGVDSNECILSVEGPPEPPSTPPKAMYEQPTNAILISWHSCTYDGGSAVTGYCLEMSDMMENDWTVLTPPSFKWLCYTLESPKPGHTYRFRVSVENAYGKGRFSSPSNGLVITSDSSHSDSDTTGSGNPDRTVSLVYNYNHTFELTEPAYEYKDVVLKNEPFLNYYDKFEQLGKGRFGVVFKVTNKATKKSYAGKFVKCIKGKDKERAQLEYKIMNELKYHPKLICLVDAFEMHRETVIVTEMINGGELFERVVADDFTLTENDCIDFLRQICCGVNYIHENKIMHLDLKPENILCTTKTSNQIKIIDFGLAQHYNPEDPISVLFGTAEFVSPEIINYDTICPATDMWSIGVITYILLSGLSPFLGDNDNETFSNITIGEFDFEDDAFDKISEEAKDFISNLIIKRKEKRLTAMQCLQHEWLALSDAEKKGIVLPTEKLKRFLVRRKWQKTGNAIRALGRITTLYSSRKSSSSSTTSPSNLQRNLSLTDSVEYDSVFGSLDAPPSPDPNVSTNPVNNALCGCSTSENREKGKYNDSSRSDSGVCDVASTSATPTPQE